MRHTAHTGMSLHQPGPARRRGAVIVYTAIIMVAFCGICSLAVDYGHVQMAKSELQRMADATARGYCELYNVNGSWPSSSNSYASALESTSHNPVTSSSAPTIVTSKTGSGYWNTATGTWSTTSGTNKNPACPSPGAR
jgi:Flp pilus assembly protein TadG